MLIKSDWHIHTECSYDASLTLSEIITKASELGFSKIGITDHLNFNDKSFCADIENSARSVKTVQKNHLNIVLGVELTPIEKPEFDYISIHGVRDGYVATSSPTPFQIELAKTKEELMSLGIRYAIGGAHWRLDLPNAKKLPLDLDASIREWYRQQMWLACDERTTILGHPWYHGKGIWYNDFSIIPRSMNMDLAAALKENKKYVECNADVICSPMASEKFKHQYAEFLRELFEMGIPITYGSDSHKKYNVSCMQVEKYLVSAGFEEGDISELSDDVLW